MGLSKIEVFSLMFESSGRQVLQEKSGVNYGSD